uniref:Uncharacterized protein n=1 Tax=Pipistrellus kuhlii TaxID=59472 RepID=A0A7J7XB77_PIPKU|nr:hypothetical protein mPipKuh1_010655 [Pipistrellus kuhlii]
MWHTGHPVSLQAGRLPARGEGKGKSPAPFPGRRAPSESDSGTVRGLPRELGFAPLAPSSSRACQRLRVGATWLLTEEPMAGWRSKRLKWSPRSPLPHPLKKHILLILFIFTEAGREIEIQKH